MRTGKLLWLLTGKRRGRSSFALGRFGVFGCVFSHFVQENVSSSEQSRKGKGTGGAVEQWFRWWVGSWSKV